MNAGIRNAISSRLLFAIIIVNLVAFLNIRIFRMYAGLSLYGNLAVLLLIFFLQNKVSRKEQDVLLFVMLFMAFGFVTLLITDGGFGSVLTPAYSVLTYWMIRRCGLDRRRIKLLLITLLVVHLYWDIHSVGLYDEFLANEQGTLNSNTVGVVLLYSTIYISIFIRYLKWKGSGGMLLVLYAVSIWAILNTESRGSLITLIMFIVFDTVLPKKVWRIKSFALLVSLAIIVLGVLFTYVYSSMYEKGISYSVPFTEKSLYSGREVIWGNFYREVGKDEVSIFIGLGSKADLWEGHELNLHNSYLTVITNFGFTGFILFFGFWLLQLNQLYSRISLSKTQARLIMGFLCVLINGLIEVSMLWNIVYFFNYMFMGLAYHLSDEDPDNSKEQSDEQDTAIDYHSGL
ncbi:O-antigen ligase family protein [Paenibacillus pinistramenti]|uniref:O-antigen ligase family protein n=1 Tax=Paenibacillus pinistramenti TaxID=1768003 RepID=UPI0011089078|nr:O-antigen ligase family protein [Paenibacillus pinistramenti]